MEPPAVTDALFPAAKASVTANNGTEEGSVINGRIMVWMDGLLRPATPSEAWSEWLWLATSPLPETQARARAIRAALTAVGHLQ
ncbi:MAG: hypothetical protein ACJAVC_000598 [Brevundimonas sp.]